MNYPCTGCGLCCKGVGQQVVKARSVARNYPDNAHLQEVANFPYGFNDQGHCEKLNADNTCSVYDTRPDICNMRTTAGKYFPNMSWEEYMQESAAVCNHVMDEARLPENMRIVL